MHTDQLFLLPPNPRRFFICSIPSLLITATERLKKNRTFWNVAHGHINLKYNLCSEESKTCNNWSSFPFPLSPRTMPDTNQWHNKYLLNE